MTGPRLVVELVKLGRGHHHENVDTDPIRAHILIRPGHAECLAHIIRVGAIEAEVRPTAGGRARCAEEVIAVEAAAQAWTRVESPNTDDRWIRETVIGTRSDMTAARTGSKRMATDIVLLLSGRLLRKGGNHGETGVSAHTVRDLH